jgi:uncharacterized protein involved in type VI secretion and phage assembly
LASQAQEQMKLSTPAGDDKLLFKRMHASEELGRLYAFDIEAYAESDALELLDLLGPPAHVALDLHRAAASAPARCARRVVAGRRRAGGAGDAGAG